MEEAGCSPREVLQAFGRMMGSYCVERPRGIRAGHQPVRKQMWWPSERGSDPEDGKGSRDGEDRGESRGF